MWLQAQATRKCRKVKKQLKFNSVINIITHSDAPTYETKLDERAPII